MKRLKKGICFFVLGLFTLVHGQMMIEGTDEQVLMYVTGDGKVGIGTTLPAAALDVDGAVRAATGLPQAGQSGNAGYSFQGDPDAGMFSPADGTVSLVTAAQQRLTLTETGNIGVGTSTPSNSLVIGADLGGGVAGNPALVLNTNAEKNGLVVAKDAADFMHYGFDNDGEFAFLSYKTSTPPAGPSLPPGFSEYDHALVWKSGNVGIGTTNLQGDALSVSGDMFVHGIKSAENRYVEITSDGSLTRGAKVALSLQEPLVKAHLDPPFTGMFRFQYKKIRNWTIEYDPNGFYQSSTSSWQVDRDGYYQVYASIDYQNYLHGDWTNWFSTFMLQIAWGTSPSSETDNIQTWQACYRNTVRLLQPRNDSIIYLNAGNYIWIKGGINTGGNIQGGNMYITYLGEQI